MITRFTCKEENALPVGGDFSPPGLWQTSLRDEEFNPRASVLALHGGFWDKSSDIRPMKLSFDHLQRCSLTLERSLQSLGAAAPGSLDAEVSRNAVIKSFELTLETAGRMLGKVLKLYVGSPRSVDALTFKELFREAARHDLLSQEELSRWLIYRDSRNETAHQYGEALAENTLRLIRDFQRDAITLYETLRSKHG